MEHIKMLVSWIHRLQGGYTPLNTLTSVNEPSPYEAEYSTSTAVMHEEIRVKIASKSAIRNAAYIMMNIGSALCLTFLNKIVVANDQLSQCQVSLAIYHFVMTFVVLLLASMQPFSLFLQVRLPVMSILPLCILFAGFLVLGNLSLQYNDMAFYSIARLMTGPTVVFLNFVFFRKLISRRALFSVIALTLGVMTASGHIGLINPFGASIATLSFTVTALYQILVGRSMTGMQVSPPQLLLNQAPLAASVLLLLLPLMDSMPSFDTIDRYAFLAFLASGPVAALFNLSQFLIIEATSALTFNVMGVVKLIGNLIMGWTIQQRLPSAIELFGVSVAIGGTCLYAFAVAEVSSEGPEPLSKTSAVDLEMEASSCDVPYKDSSTVESGKGPAVATALLDPYERTSRTSLSFNANT